MIQKFNCASEYSTHIHKQGVLKFRVYLDKQFELNVITNKRNTEKSPNGLKYAYFELLNATIFCWANHHIFSFSFTLEIGSFPNTNAASNCLTDVPCQRCHYKRNLSVDQRSLSCYCFSPGRGMLIELTHSICSGSARLMSARLKVLHLASIFDSWANASCLLKLATLNVIPQSRELSNIRATHNKSTVPNTDQIWKVLIANWIKIQ